MVQKKHFLHFSCVLFAQFKKKQYLCTRIVTTFNWESGAIEDLNESGAKQ